MTDTDEGKRKMIKRNIVLLLTLLITAACSGNDAPIATEAVTAPEQAPPAAVESTDTPGPATSPTPLPEAAAGAAAEADGAAVEADEARVLAREANRV